MTAGLRRWSLQVEAPERVWTVPGDFVATDEVLGGRVRLAGYRLSAEQVAPGDRLDVALAWQATEEMDVAYRVFLHLVGPDGTLVAQDDGEPVGWTRPTTGWAVGEVVVDPRAVTIPDGAADGTYEVRVGLYDADGVRLTTSSGADEIVLGTVTVMP